jgi:pimeloyl-ACP methyl ester carboxylesterase
LIPSHPEVCVIEHAGHMLTMEEPASVAQVFLNWLS